ncbi:PEGA domain-containing protein [Shewanella insulae]|uniref:PEGA domain-containing protein n=1 Tax=Shewanella insulae TaxID=2681496 RepID=UPI001EFE508B|nr:PEGA domain-containing protein [Shewanella insulae]MCG9736991.1 PEGA domain-containing protein [Shewanella insulae]
MERQLSNKPNTQLSRLPNKHSASPLLSLVILSLISLPGCGSGGDDGPTSEPPVAPPVATPTPEASLTVSASESGGAIYLDGRFTGKLTPAELTLAPGEHSIGVGLNQSEQYLRRTVQVEADQAGSLALDETDRQAPKTWKALFIGVAKVQAQGGSCVSQYQTEQLDAGFDFFRWSFEERVEPYSYHTMDWQFERMDITDEVVTLSRDKLIGPAEIEPHLTNVDKGDYDLIVSFFRGGAGSDECYIDDFKGIAWYDYRVLDADASYYTIRFYDDVTGRIEAAKTDDRDPGMYIHEWLHTTAEWFFPDQGYPQPSSDGQVVHAAEAYGYSWPWMGWYRDLIRAQVKQQASYVGIGPDALLGCSVSEDALGLCPSAAGQAAPDASIQATPDALIQTSSLYDKSAGQQVPWQTVSQPYRDGRVTFGQIPAGDRLCLNRHAIDYRLGDGTLALTLDESLCGEPYSASLSFTPWQADGLGKRLEIALPVEQASRLLASETPIADSERPNLDELLINLRAMMAR